MTSFLLEPSPEEKADDYIRGGGFEEAALHYNTAHFQSQESPIYKMEHGAIESEAPTPFSRSHIQSLVVEPAEKQHLPPPSTKSTRY